MFEKDNTAGLFTLYFTKQRISNDRHHTKCMFYDICKFISAMRHT